MKANKVESLQVKFLNSYIKNLIIENGLEYTIDYVSQMINMAIDNNLANETYFKNELKKLKK